jgi:hypothetical protein
MSKGMHNLISMTHAAQNKKVFMHVGYNNKENWVNFCDDKDCIPADITQYRTAEFESMADFWEKIGRIENELKYHVVVNTSYMFYETGENNGIVKTFNKN